MNALTSLGPKIAVVLGLFALACSDDGGTKEENTAGSAGTAGTDGTTGATGGTTASGGTAGSGGTGGIVDTPMGTLFMDDFEAGATNWDVTQGTCMVVADDGTNVFTCIQGTNEARAVAGDIWGEYSVQARVRINAFDATGGRRIYLAPRFTDSNNWYGAAICDGGPTEIQIRKRVAGTSTDIDSERFRQRRAPDFRRDGHPVQLRSHRAPQRRELGRRAGHESVTRSPGRC